MAAKKTHKLPVNRPDALIVDGHSAIELFQMHCDFIEKDSKLFNKTWPSNEVEAQAYVEGLCGLYERLDDQAKQRSHIIDMIKARYEEPEPVYELTDLGYELAEIEEAMKAPVKKKRGRPRKVAK